MQDGARGTMQLHQDVLHFACTAIQTTCVRRLANVQVHIITHAGAVGYLDEGFIEYDLDAGDYAWLETFDEGQNRLPARRFEMLMWRLELANAAATENVLAGAGKLMAAPAD